jgi:hypothetical protein
MDIFVIKQLLNKLPFDHPLIKSKLIYEVVAFIGERRKLLLNDLIAYAKDPVRYKRRMRMLIQLSQYEQQILTKLDNFELTDDIDTIINDLMREIYDVVNLNA